MFRVNTKSSAAKNSTDAFVVNRVNWDIEKYRDEHECEEHWQLRKAFMEKWKNNFPEERLICLARVYTNIEFMGCRYPAPVMQQIAQLSFEVGQKYKDNKKTKLQRTFVSASTAAEDRARGLKRVGGEIVTDVKPKSTRIEFVATQAAALGNTGTKVPLTHPLTAPQANLSQLDVTCLHTRAAPSARLAALAPTALAAAHAPPDTTMTATSAPTDTTMTATSAPTDTTMTATSAPTDTTMTATSAPTDTQTTATSAPTDTQTTATSAPTDTQTTATSAPPTLTKVIPSTRTWQQNIVRNSITNNPVNVTDNTRLSSLDGELRALALQRQSIEARLREIVSLGKEKEAESGGSGFMSVDEVGLLKRKRLKIRNRQRLLKNRLCKIRERNSPCDAQTVACKGVRDQPQVREGETQREKQPDAETCGQGPLREGETQCGTSLPAPGPSGGNDRNRTETTQDRQRNRKKRGKRAGFLHRVSLAQKTVSSPSEPQPGPSGQRAAKKVRPDDTASPSTLQGDAKRVKIQTAQGEQRTYAPATKDIPARLAVAICLWPPSRDMTTDEAEHIKLSLEDLVMDADPSKPLPAFRGYPRVANGTVQIWCEDDSALTWLTQIVPKIKLPKTDATLTVLRQSDVSTRVRAALFVPRYNGDIARLQNVLTRQNPWYDIGRWSLYRATSVGGNNPGTYMTLGIPTDEVEKVLGRERRVSYLLGSIYVRFLSNTHPSDTQTTTTDSELTKPAPTELDLTVSQLEEEMARTADAVAVRMPISPPDQDTDRRPAWTGGRGAFIR